MSASLYLALLFLNSAASLYSNVTFVILAQKSQFDDLKASTLKDSILWQGDSLWKDIKVIIPHIDIPDFVGYWAPWTLLSRISLSTPSEWYIFLETESVVNASILFDFLNEFSFEAEIFLGNGLYDESPTIIHHYHGFDDYENSKFLFPDFAAGVVLSNRLVTRLIKMEGATSYGAFAIDPKHEFALMVYKVSRTQLSSYPDRFCLQKKDNCAIYFEEITCPEQPLLSKDDIFVSVKTFSGFHNTRIPVIKRTWAAPLSHIAFFSDIANRIIPTIDVGLQNTERGHCAKMFFILKHFNTLVGSNSHSRNFKWFVVTDDDTLLSIPRLLRLLSCYDHTEKLIIGERYGYGFSNRGNSGYDYPTGGAGIILSPSAVQALVLSCNCPSDDSPDDMVIGLCSQRNGVSIIHNAAFHQARPTDYPEPYIRRVSPISFHKFDDIDPYEVFMEYLFEPHLERDKAEL